MGVGKGEGQAQGYRLPPSNTNAIWRPEKLCWQTSRFTPRCTIKPWEWMLPTAEIFFSFCHAVSPVRSPFPTQAFGSESGES